MRTIHYISNNPYFAQSTFEAIQEDTLYFLEVSDHVFIGKHCPINRWVNKENTLPVVRGAVLGNSLLFDNGKSLLIAISTKEETSELFLQEVIIETLNRLGLKDVSISSNDIIYNGKQLGMTAPPEQYSNFLTAGQLSFNIDIEKHKKTGDKSILLKINKLLNELRQHPKTGTGKPEILKHGFHGLYSRRINKKHRRKRHYE